MSQAEILLGSTTKKHASQFELHSSYGFQGVMGVMARRCSPTVVEDQIEHRKGKVVSWGYPDVRSRLGLENSSE